MPSQTACALQGDGQGSKGEGTLPIYCKSPDKSQGFLMRDIHNRFTEVLVFLAISDCRKFDTSQDQ